MDNLWAFCGWFARSALQRVWLLVGGDNFARLRHTLFFLFFQLVELRLILLNQRPLVGRLKITQTLSHTHFLVTFSFDGCEANFLRLRFFVILGGSHEMCAFFGHPVTFSFSGG